MIEFCSEAEDMPLLEPISFRFAPILNNLLTYEVDSKPAEESSSPAPVLEEKDTNFQALVSHIRRMDADLLAQKLPFLTPPVEMGKLVTHKDEGKKEDEPQKI